MLFQRRKCALQSVEILNRDFTVTNHTPTNNFTYGENVVLYQITVINNDLSIQRSSTLPVQENMYAKQGWHHV